MKPTTLLLVDDHIVVRQGMRKLFDARAEVRVVGEAATGLQAVELAKRLSPDIVIMDIVMPVLDGLEATRLILREVPAAKVIMLTSYDSPEYVRRAKELGASGYVLKHDAMAYLLQVIQAVRSGKVCFSPGLGRRPSPQFRGPASAQPPGEVPSSGLTSRQVEVLRLIAEGEHNRQIGARLQISVKTVEKHRQAVMDKLDIHDTAGLTRYAITRGIVEKGSRVPAW